MKLTLSYARGLTLKPFLLIATLGVALFFGCESGFAKLKKSAYKSKFGVMTPGPSGNYRVYAETTYIYRNPDKDYAHGFEVMRKDGTRFNLSFEIRFPEPINVSPELEKAYTVLEGGRLIRSQAEMHWEFFSAPFWFSEDDPLGTYEMKIFLDDELYRTINYEVVPFESGF